MLQDIIEDLQGWLRQGNHVALATVVATWGSAPRRPSSKMAVRDTGEMVGSVSGGCVEGAVVAEALEVLKTGRPRLLKFTVQDEQAWDVGLACGGDIQIFVETVSRESDEVENSSPLMETIERRLRLGEPVVRAGAVRGPDALLGQSAVLTREGVLSGDALLAAVGSLRDEAAAILASGAPRSRVFLQPEGEIEIFFDLLQPAPTLVIVGGVHIAVLLTQLAKIVGFRVVIVDPRRQFASPERFPLADDLVRLWPDEGLRTVGLTPATAVAVLSHDPKLDDPALVVALRSQASYVGALGSERATANRRRRLLDAGLKNEEIARLHAPIGVRGLGDSPEEIALGILTEIVATPGLTVGQRAQGVQSRMA